MTVEFKVHAIRPSLHSFAQRSEDEKNKTYKYAGLAWLGVLKRQVVYEPGKFIAFISFAEMTERLRRRNVSNGGKGDDENGHWSDLNGKHFNTSDRDELHLTFFHCFAVILFHVCTFSLAVYAHHYVPETKSGVNRSDFAEWRARAHLHDITSFGSRPAGSYANENLTVAFLLRTLHAIKESSGEGITLDIDVQRPTGSFTIDFLEGFTSHYRNVSNVVARVSSKKNYPAEHSVLVNAHFDSAFGGAGASDDAVSCAAMLEVIRCLAESSTDTAERLHHSLVFLFNGAEENVLQASHGFITQHPWAKYVRVFVNLEAAGAGGREIVFQTGPEHPWLIKTYANSANYPFASIIGQEFFQTGLIPGETDFRIFRDYGHIPGIDIAYVSNGYVYHTRRDLPEAITPGSIQRAGENLLEMVKQLSRSPLVADPSEDRHGAMVFYDFLGLFLVIYPQRIGSILNTLVAVLAFVCIGMKFIKRPGNGGATNKNVLSRYKYRCGNLSVFAFVKALCAILVSWFVALAFVLAIAQVITMNDRSLSWYCKPYLLVGLYVLPAVLTMAGVHYYRATKCQDKDNWWARWDQEEHAFYAVLFLWNLLLSLMTYYDLGSAFLPMLLVAFPLLGRVLLWEIWSGNGYSVNVRKHCNRYVTMYFISNAVPVLICSYILWMHLDFIVPILGRTGSNDAPELLISVFVSLFALVILSYFTNLVYVVNRAKPFALALSGVSLVSVIVVILGFVFPYSAQPWCPKRVIFQHTSRAIHDLHGQLQHEDSGVWVVPFDYLGIKYIDHLPEFKNASTPDLQKGLFGDFPYYMPVNFMFDKTWYIPGPPPQLKIMSTIELISQENHSDGHRRLNFNLDGPSHMSLHISPKLGVRLRNSSLGKLYRRNIPGKGLTVREEYFVYYSHGLYTGPWLFWLELEHVSSYDGVVDIGVVGHYSDEKDSQSTFMNSFIRKLPEWVDATVWASMYERWTF